MRRRQPAGKPTSLRELVRLGDEARAAFDHLAPDERPAAVAIYLAGRGTTCLETLRADLHLRRTEQRGSSDPDLATPRKDDIP